MSPESAEQDEHLDYGLITLSNDFNEDFSSGDSSAKVSTGPEVGAVHLLVVGPGHGLSTHAIFLLILYTIHKFGIQ